jgi:hypothetical protein
MQIRMVGEKMGYLLWTFSCSHGRRDVSSDRGDKRKSKQCSYIALYACKSMHMRLVDSLGEGILLGNANAGIFDLIASTRRNPKQCSNIALYACKSMHMRLVMRLLDNCSGLRLGNEETEVHRLIASTSRNPKQC